MPVVFKFHWPDYSSIGPNLTSGVHFVLVKVGAVITLLALTCQLVGLAWLQHQCDETNPATAPWDAVFTLTPDMQCTRLYRYQWLSAAAQALAVCLMLAYLSMGLVVSGRLALVCLYAVAAVLAITNSHTGYFQVKQGDLSGKYEDYTIVYLVGCFASAAANLLMCILLGTHDELSDRALPLDGVQQYNKNDQVVGYNQSGYYEP